MAKPPAFKPVFKGDIITRWGVYSVGLVLVTVVGLVLAARATGYGVMRLEASHPVQTRAVLFEDRADGTLAIFDAGGTEPFEIIAPDKSGFIRGSLRALKQFRRVNRAGPEVPFELIRWADGRFSLRDPADGREIALEAFGPTNAAEYQRLLTMKKGANI